MQGKARGVRRAALGALLVRALDAALADLILVDALEGARKGVAARRVKEYVAGVGADDAKAASSLVLQVRFEHVNAARGERG